MPVSEGLHEKGNNNADVVPLVVRWQEDGVLVRPRALRHFYFDHRFLSASVHYKKLMA